MKRFYKLLGIAALAAVIAIGLAGCPTDDGGGGGGGNIDTAKLKGTWVKDDNPALTLEIGDVQNAGTKSAIIEFYCYMNGEYLDGGYPGIEGNVIGYGDSSLKVAFEGDKLKISGANGDFDGLDGLYTKQ
jgi:hypothetical protein